MIKRIYTAILGVSLLAGCSKDPSNVSPTDQYSTSNYPASINDLNSVLASSYSNMRDAGYLGFHFLPKALSNSMHCVDAIYDGDPGWNEMAKNNLTVSNQYAAEAWQVLFTGVKNCNVTLKAADFYQANYSKGNDAADVDAIRGQAYTLRAYYYMQLECLFGESYITTTGGGDKRGVPIFDKVPSSLDSTAVPRSTVKAVWDLVKSDLQKAATLLKGKVWSGDDRGKATEWTAKGLLGKAYVYTQDWANAQTTLQDVITHSGKTLMPYAKYRDAFVGNANNEFNEESLFELNIDPDSKGNYGVYGDNINATSINGLIWCPWNLGPDGTEGGSQPMGYGNEIFHDRSVVRFGYTLGSYTLVDNPNFNSSKPAAFDNPKKIMDPAYRTNAVAARTNLTVDPRLYVAGLQPWVDSVKPDGKTWYPVSMPAFFAGQTNRYGFSVRKNAVIYNNINNQGPADGANFYLLRLADVYLLYAEALHNAGSDATGLEYLNKVKRRAYNLPVDAASAIDYKSFTDVTPANSAADPVLGHNPLYYERWAELYNEGSWWFDVCRWRIGKSEADFYQNALNVHEGTLSSQWSDAKSYVWPIPLTELNSNPKITSADQNPGYN